MQDILDQLSRHGFKGRIKTLQRRFHHAQMENGAPLVGRMEH